MVVVVSEVRFENLGSNVLGIGTARPRISWSFEGNDQDWYQAAYEIELIHDREAVQTYQVKTSNNVVEPWPSKPLRSGQTVVVRVRAADESTTWTEWSAPATIEAGLLSRDDWQCSVVEQDVEASTGPHRPVIFRRQFDVPRDVSKARLYITAHGVYAPILNGMRVGDHVLAPGWTSYSHRLSYQTFDVTSLLVEFNNTLEVIVAEGWYCGKLGWIGERYNVYGDQMGLIALLVFEDDENQIQRIGSDEEWQWAFGPLQAAGLYDGVAYDLHHAISTSTQWRPVKAKPLNDNLVGPISPPVRRTRNIKPINISTSPAGKTIVDFGQNVVGWTRLRISSLEMCHITCRFAEVLSNGEIATLPLRSAKATDELTLDGSRPVKWEPEFTFHGFRYVEVSGWPGELRKENITAVVIHTDMKQTATFNCSNKLLNKLYENVLWSTRGNFLSIPTDCPQRDERMGWTGDINMFGPTANFLLDTAGMLRSWLADLRLEQQAAGGIVPLVIPNIYEDYKKDAHAVWGDVAIMLPWSLYQAFGDKSILEDQYDSMKAWMRAIPRRRNGLWDYSSNWKLADWLDPATPPGDPGLSSTDPTHVSDAFLVHITYLMVKISCILGDLEGRKKFSAEAQALHVAYTDEYITPSGLLAENTQTAYALALAFDLFPTAAQRARAAERLENIVRRNARFHIATGFAGTPYIGHALTSVGKSNIFYRMLLSTSCPSWLYPVTMGATTIWERWDSMLPDGSINTGQMTSFNHYALGSVAGWMHENILGLRIRQPGWKEFDVRVAPGGNLKWAEGSHECPYGLITVRWRIKQVGGRQTFWLEVRVPPNTTSHVYFPGSEKEEVVGSGLRHWEVEYEDPGDWPPEPIIASKVVVPESELAYFDEVLPCPWEEVS